MLSLKCSLLLLFSAAASSSQKRPCALPDNLGLGVCTTTCPLEGVERTWGKVSVNARSFKCGPGKVCCPQKKQKQALKRKEAIKSNGCDKQPGDFPASLVRIQQSGRDICSGILVTPSRVLTAAMCVNIGRPSVMVGGETVDTLRTLLHPEFESENMTNNLAVLELEHEVGVRPTCLGDGQVAGGVFREVGWGTFEKGDKSELSDRRLEEVEERECEDMVGSSGIDFVNFHLDYKEMVCLRTEESAEKCVGDLGGPLLFTNRKTGSVEVVGVRTVPLMCGPFLGLANFPAVYTRLEPYRHWIGSLVE